MVSQEGFRAPRRGLGQNFLVDPNLQRRIVESIEILPGDLVVEIGPGRGALTRGLLERADHLVLVEKDDALAEHWVRETHDLDHVQVIHGDILRTPLHSLGPVEHMRVVGNIPYNITAPILFHVLTRPRPLDVVVMVQREVADRLLAEPGTGEYGALTVGIRLVARVSRLVQVPRTAFKPRPRVDSTVVRIVPSRPPDITAEMEEEVRRLTRAVFGWRRKKLRTVLRDHPDYALGVAAAESVLSRAGIDPDVRGETLGTSQFVALARFIAGF